MIKLLLLSAGTNACYHIAKIVNEKWHDEIIVIGADINDKHLLPTIGYLDKFYQVRPNNVEGYYEEILSICKAEQIDYLLPSFDADQKMFYPENPDLLALGVVALGTSKDTLTIYDNKALMNAFLQDKSFPTPQNYLVSDCFDDVYYMVKPINGVGSIGAGLKLGKDIKSLDTTNFIIQERCFDPEYTVECFVYDGTISTVCRERIATKAGVCTKTRIFKSYKLESIVNRFSQILKTPHIFNLQFMMNSKGEFVITDVNLRTAGGMSLSYAAGWDEVSALVKIMLGKTKEDVFSTLPQLLAEQYVVRAYTDLVTEKNPIVVAFDWDGTLLDSRKRHSVVMDDVLQEYRINIDTSDLVEFKRTGQNNVAYLLSKGVDKEIADKIQQKWIAKIEDKKYLQDDVLYSDVKELLEKYANCKKILITARSDKSALFEQVSGLGMKDCFEQIYVVPADAKVTEHKAEVLRKNKANLFIGDTLSDYNAAQLSGVLYEHRNRGFHDIFLIKGSKYEC